MISGNWDLYNPMHFAWKEEFMIVNLYINESYINDTIKLQTRSKKFENVFSYTFPKHITNVHGAAEHGCWRHTNLVGGTVYRLTVETLSLVKISNIFQLQHEESPSG